MPTALPRHPVTETDDIAAVLDVAARRWPGVPRARLIRLVLADWAAGHRSPAARAEALRSLAGTMPGISGLYDRNEDWPE